MFPLPRSALALLVAVVATTLGCAHATTRATPRRLARGTPTSEASTTTAPAPLVIVESNARIELSVPAGGDDGRTVPVTLGARVTRAEGTRGPGILIVPGAGDVSRDGTRRGDGVVVYASPVDVYRKWARAFAARGAVVLSWDKRTCGKNDVPTCTTNPQGDVDARGPVALAADVDAACALLRRDPGFDGHLVLFAHGQAGQVALSSTCAQTADAIVVVSPIPRAVDEVIVDALLDRKARAEAAAKAAKTPDEKAAKQEEANALKNLAGTRQAGFASIRSGKFASDARVDGATIAFWLGWMKLTSETPALFSPVKDKVIVVVGGDDRQLSDADRRAALALPARRTILIEGADHHLLIGESLPPEVTEPVLSALDAVLRPGDA